MHVEHLPAPIILLSPSGEDSLLVYTYDNQLYHFIISATSSAVKLIQVGQIGFHGIIRAPARVRALSWVLPEEQLADSDPTQDVALATVVFLVDGKLVLLQPSTKESGDLKYDMRIIASNVEYYALIRDQHHFRPSASETMTTMQGLPPALSGDGAYPNDLQDSLWYFDGVDMRVWTDVQDVLASTSTSEDISRELPTPIQISVDFYPLSVLLSKGLLFGVETEMVQRRDVSFTFSKFVARVSTSEQSACWTDANRFTRLISSYRQFCVITFLSITRQARCTSRTTISTSLTLHTRWRSSCMTYSTTKSTSRPRLPKLRSYPQCCLFCHRSRSFSTSWSSARVRQRCGPGVHCSTIYRRRATSSKARSKKAG